ncbi:MAG: VanZ family protein [Sedimentisphaerales bacterium]|nr:VanZ family protein [Sedimentisphaerales bacterium]
MATKRRWNLAIISLAIYWPTLFLVAHIPMPEKVHKAGVSDKALHFLAYATLVFLLWIALNPGRKVCWRRAAVWWVLLGVAAYGIIDELLQSYVGRSCDAMDFVSDLAGAVTSCIIMTYLTFWPASLVLVAAIIFGLTNIARERLADVVPVANAMFHLFSYAVFTVIWVCYRRSKTLTISRFEAKWLITTLTPPIALLVFVKGYSLTVGREFPIYDVILSLAGIAGAVAIGTAVLMRKSANQGPPGPDD